MPDEKKETDSETDFTQTSFHNILLTTHPSFLEALRVTYPLAFLGSLSIVIATFLRNGASNAQQYAIAAGVVFLLAFSSSLLSKFLRRAYVLPSVMAFLSYIFFVSGMVLLFWLCWELVRVFWLGSVVILLAMTFYFIVFMSIALWWWITRLSKVRVEELLRKGKRNLADALSVALFTVSLGYVLLMIWSVTGAHTVLYTLLTSGLKGEVPVSNLRFLLVISVLGLLSIVVGAVVAKIIIMMSRKDKKNLKQGVGNKFPER